MRRTGIILRAPEGDANAPGAGSGTPSSPAPSPGAAVEPATPAPKAGERAAQDAIVDDVAGLKKEVAELKAWASPFGVDDLKEKDKAPARCMFHLFGGCGPECAP